MTDTISNLKSVVEKIDKNYSSTHLLNTLDKCLYRSIKNVLKCSNFFQIRLSGCFLHWYSTVNKRSISKCNKEHLGFLVALFNNEKDPKKCYKVLKSMRLERSVLFLVLEDFLKCLRMYKTSLNLKSIPKVLEVNKSLFFTCYDKTKVYFDSAIQLRNAIVEKYMRHAMMESKSFYVSFKRKNPVLSIEQAEVANSFVLAIIKAINRCDQNAGTLTNHITNWLKNAKCNRNLITEYGTAYSVPQSNKKSFNLKNHGGNAYLNIDSDEAKNIAHQQNEESLEVLQLRKVAKELDPKGYARLPLGIMEILS